MPALNVHLLGTLWGSPRACSRQLKGVSRIHGGHGNQTGSVGPGRPTLGARTAERFGVTRKVTPRAAGYQGQHISCEWVIEVSTLRPRNPTHEKCYRVKPSMRVRWLKMRGRGTTPHCGQILRPCRKVRRHVGRTV
ncbi:UNVERIFIED_CONTAM: hypothetical protein Sradi_6255100 [Sesamum radiatum]|uniref:Uncharacterized protein n=1 Tax=Sesamum radiatum TaxID=300843 RepID=A0AAW2KAR3_SESRA